MAPKLLSRVNIINSCCYNNNTQVHAAVSGALDRLHYEKDPCVKYDSSKKVWVYLHRNRTRDEFGMFTF